jgi:hypothetical protein
MIVAIDANTFNTNYVMFQEKINNMIDGNSQNFLFVQLYEHDVYIKLPFTVSCSTFTTKKTSGSR